MHYTLMLGQLPKSLAAFATNLTNFCYPRVSHWLATDLSKHYDSGQNLKPTNRTNDQAKIVDPSKAPLLQGTRHT